MEANLQVRNDFYETCTDTATVLAGKQKALTLSSFKEGNWRTFLGQTSSPAHVGDLS